MTTKFKLINVSGQVVGPIDIFEIWGRFHDSPQPTVTLEVDGEHEFCAEGEPDDAIDLKLAATLSGLGTYLGGGGVILDRADPPMPEEESEELQPPDFPPAPPEDIDG